MKKQAVKLGFAKRLTSIVADALLLTTGALGSLFCLLSAFEIVVDSSKIIIAVALAALVLCAVFSLSRAARWAATVVALMGCVLYGLLNAEAINEQATFATFRIIVIASAALSRGTPVLPEGIPAGWESTNMTEAFLLLALLLVVYLAWSVCAHRSFVSSFVLTLLLLGGPLFLTITPAWLPLCAVLVFWFVMLGLDCADDMFNSPTPRLGLILLPIGAALCLLLLLIFPSDAYSRPESLNDIRSRLVVWDFNYSTSVFKGFGTSSRAGQVNFTNSGDRVFNGTIMLTVTDSSRQDHYLRGNTGATYTGKGFDALPERAYEEVESRIGGSLLNITGYSRASQRSIAVQYQKANRRFVYVPYVLSSTPQDMNGLDFLHDYAIRNTANVDIALLSFIPIPEAAKDNSSSTALLLYGEFVRKHYLEIDDGLKKTLLAELTKNGASLNTTQERAIYDVLNYLSKTATYTLSPGKTPRNADFIEYFLFENKQGYCIHFATSATMMLRALGIPARYAEGYVVRRGNYNSSGVANIPDRQAHAWVEVFDPQLGWMPVEFTPGAGLGEVGEASIFEIENTPPQTDIGPTPTPELIPATPEPTPANEPTPAPGSTSGENTDEDGDGGTQRVPVHPLIWALLCLVAAVAAYTALRIVLLKKRAAAFSQPDANARVIAMYAYLERLRKYGLKLTPQMRKTGEKAAFSKAGVSESEAQAFNELMLEARAALYKQQKPLKRAWLCIICLY